MWKARLNAFAAFSFSFLLAGCSVFGGKVAGEPAYRVVERDGDIEIREYVGFAVAETSVTAPFDEAVGEGFRRLFDYISGANRGSAEIDMTAPVLALQNGEKVAMTAPVLARPADEIQGGSAAGITAKVDEGWSIGFVLPEGMTAASAPTPTDQNVMLRDLPPRRIASIRFSGRFRNSTAEMKRQTLADWLASRGVSHRGDWRLAGYNPPWTIPALRRNEVMVTVR